MMSNRRRRQAKAARKLRKMTFELLSAPITGRFLQRVTAFQTLQEHYASMVANK